MPAKPQWLLKIPAIFDQLRSLEIPVLDRSVCERIFGVRRRRAVQLMHRLGGYQSGNTVLLDRINLSRQLEAQGLSSDFGNEQHRKTRLAQKLDSLHQYRTALCVRIPVVPVATGILPDGIAFSVGRMTVEFAGVEELLGK